MVVASRAEPRQRMAREDRLRQLLDVAWRLVRERGTEALSLVRLAEAAGVTKPLVYGHFGTRNGLLITMYEEFDTRQLEVMEAALAASGPALGERAAVIASSYVECVLQQGREIPGVIAALAGSPELEEVRRHCQFAFLEKCRAVLRPFAERIPDAALWAMLGAADGLANAAAAGDITAKQAQNELQAIVVAMVERTQASVGRKRR
jgi:AcrR family transcriptional regulator